MIVTANFYVGQTAIIDVDPDTTGLLVGMGVVGSGIQAGTVITSIFDSTTFYISLPTTATLGGVTLEINTVLHAASTAAAEQMANLSFDNENLKATASASAHGTGNLYQEQSDLHANAGASAAGAASLSTVLGISGSGEGSASAVLHLSIEVRLDCSAVAAATTAADLEIFTNSFLAAMATAAATTAGALSLVNDFSAVALATASVQGGLTVDMQLEAHAHAGGDSGASLTFVGQGLGVCAVIDDIFLLWGVEDPAMAIEALRDRALTDLNAAMQIVWTQARDRDYFSRRTLSVTVPEGSGEVELDQEVQNVLGPVRREADRVPLQPLSSRSEVDQFGNIFLGGSGGTMAPLAFFVERLNQSRADNTRIVLHVVPAPTEDTDFLVDAAMECPRYVWRDYCHCTPLEIPHRYTESILLPICRHRAASSQYFVREERREAIDREYVTALQVLGGVDPQIKETEETAKKGDGG